MTDATVVIGVNKTGGLPPLAGAVTGANAFAAWAADQGVQVTLITDENQAVTLEDIQNAVDAILEPRNCKKLILFFAGHGFLISPQVELWLLSKAPDRGQEAVNVQLSLSHARYCGVEHIIFVSDACRSGGPTHQHRSVTGASVFPPPKTYDFDGKLDAFYATRPGDTALEYKTEQEAVDSYRGLFTEALLHALQGNVPDVVREYTDDGSQRWLITSDLLEDHLEAVVPLRAEHIDVKLSQTPIVIPESRVPQCFGELPTAPVSTRRTKRGTRTAAPPEEADVTTLVRGVQDDAMSFEPVVDVMTDAVSSAPQRVFSEQMERIAAVRGRDHFETETGFTVFGAVRAAVVGGSWKTEVFQADQDTFHIRVIPEGQAQARSVLIEFESGLGTVLAIKPGFIGTVMLEEGQVVNVNYTPSANTDLFQDEYAQDVERIERRRAFAATATRHGIFQFRSDEAKHAGDYLRMMKRLDPTLGIYAAYAYHQAGRIESIQSIVNYMAGDGLVLFDVLLLARLPEPWPDHGPFCPMLRQGWALLSLHPPAAERLAPLQTLLVPGLWATFTEEGVARVRNGLEMGEFQ